MLPVPTLSYSKVHRYKLCPQSYFRLYVDPYRRHEKPDSDLTGTLPGHVVDRIAQVALRAADKTQPGRVTEVNLARFDDNKLLYAVFKDFLEDPRVRLDPANAETEHLAWATDERTALNFIRECRDNLHNLLTSHELIQPFMLREWKFGSTQNPVVLNDHVRLAGAADLLTGAAPAAPLRLIDYKATHSDFRLDRDQLKIYQLAAQHHGLKIGMTGFLMFKTKRQPLYFAFKKDELADTTGKLVQISKDIQAEKFDYTPSKSACGLCDHRDVCPQAVKPDTPLTPPRPKEALPVPKFEIPEL